MSRTVTNGIHFKNSVPFPFIFRFFFFLMSVAQDFANWTVSSSSLYRDFFCCFALGGSLFTVATDRVAYTGGLWVGKLTNLPFVMISFQLAALPIDSFSALSPVIQAAFTAYSRYCWLSILLSSNSEVSVSSRHLLSGGRLQRPMLSYCSICFVISCFASSLIIMFVWWCLVILSKVHCG